MKVLKGISLFFLYPLTVFVLGFWSGVKTEHFFYPGETDRIQQEPSLEAVSVKPDDVQTEYVSEKKEIIQNIQNVENVETWAGDKDYQETKDGSDDILTDQSVARRETLSVDTAYVLIETDILHGTEVETNWRLPGQYIGMDRDQFLVAIENYSSYPPLSEMERGFVSAEVISFARERVVVRKSYHSVQADEGFYVAVVDHEVVVYMEDKETLYMNTGILLENLPEEVQIQIMQMLYLEDEGALYSFLETYTS